MQVKEAVALAKQYVRDVFAEELITDLGLEEVEFDDARDIWSITIGFSRPWDTGDNPIASVLGPRRKRDYKIIRIKDSSKQVLSVKNRETAS